MPTPSSPTYSSQSEALWSREQLFFQQPAYFEAVLQDIHQAEQRIDLEMYIFQLQALGRRVLDALEKASQRGVWVRILVDGIGSAEWDRPLFERLEQANIEVRVYHPLWRVVDRLFSLRWWGLLQRLNRRDHRKLILIDQQCAYLGSMNIAQDHATWRETGIRVEGGAILDLFRSFEIVWERSNLPNERVNRLQRLSQWFSREFEPEQSLVRSNHNRRLRRNYNRERLRRISMAQHRVWLTSAYFVPSPALLKVLLRAAHQGCDVRLLVPNRSDVKIVKWLGGLYYHTLLKAGLRIYEYLPDMMHAKTLMVDDWVVLGTSNLNYRSLYHDLELDIVVTGQAAKQELLEHFQLDLQQSKTVDADSIGGWRGFEWCGQRLAGFIQYWF